MARDLELTLSNGLRIRVVQDDSLGPYPEFAWLNLVAHSGAGDDPAGRKGLAHVVEHVVRRKLPENEILFSRRLKAAHRNRQLIFGTARTEMDYTSFPFGARLELLPDALRYYRDWLESVPRDDDSYLRSCTIDVLAEKMKMLEKRPNPDLYDALYATAFRAHRYSGYSIGHLADLRATTPSDVRRFIDRRYRLRDLTLSCMISRAPGADAEKVLDRMARALCDLKGPSRSPAKRAPAERGTPAGRADQKAIRFREVPAAAAFSPSLVLGAKVPERLTWRTSGLFLLSQAVAGAVSRLQSDFRPHLESLGCDYFPMIEGGFLEIRAQLKSGEPVDRLREVLARVSTDASRIADEGIEPDELERIKKFSVAVLARRREAEAFALDWPQFVVGGRKYSDLVGMTEEIARATASDLAELARVAIVPARRTIAASVSRSALLPAP